MYNVEKITQEGQQCRHCSTPVVKATHKIGWQVKKNQAYYFKWWFKCPNKRCRALYMVEAAKVRLTPEPEPSLDVQLKQRIERES